MKCFSDWLARYIFCAGYSFAETATMLTGAQIGTPEHEAAEREVMDAIRRIHLAEHPVIKPEGV